MIQFTSKWFKISILCLMLGILAGCGPAPSDDPTDSGPVLTQPRAGHGSAAETSSTGPVRRTAWSSGSGDLRIESMRAVDTGLELDLLLDTGGLPPANDESFAFCLPPAANPKLALRSYHIGDRVLFDDAATTETETENVRREFERRASVAFSGYTRNWPIYRLALKRHFLREVVVNRAVAEPHRITLKLSFDQAQDQAPLSVYSSSPVSFGEPIQSIRELVAQFVANPEDLDRYRVERPPFNQDLQITNTDPRSFAPETAAWARVAIENAGLYRLDPEQLVALNIIPNAARLGEVVIVNRGKVVPTHVQARANASAPSGVYFYAWPLDSKYSTQETYWIAQADESTTRLQTLKLDSLETTRTLDSIRRMGMIDNDNEIKLELGDFLSIRNVEWFDRELLRDETLELTLELHDPVQRENADVQLTVFTGVEGPNPLWMNTGLKLMAGSAELGRIDVRAEGITRSVFTAPISAFANNRTQLTIEVDKPTSATALAGDAAGVWFDRVEWTYDARPTLLEGQLQLDRQAVPAQNDYLLPIPAGAEAPLAIALNPDTRAAHLAPVSGGNWIIHRDNPWIAAVYDLSLAALADIQPQQWPQDLLNPGERIDYVIITHPLFEDAIQPLVELQEQRGLKTRIVNVKRIYDVFGNGDLNPEAIRAFLGWTSVHWPGGGPSYVLLVGDASADYLDETRGGVENFVPTYTYAHHQDAWASDYWLGCVHGKDDLADFMIGRFSVTTADEARVVVDKTLEYARANRPGPWRARMVYVADNFESFRKTAEDIRTEYTPSQFEARRIYLDELPLEDNWYLPLNYIEREYDQRGNWMKVSGVATNTIKKTFDDGLAVLEFFGHGSPNIWTDERIWFGGGSPNRDNQYLAQTRQYAFVVNYTCNSGAIDYPRPPWNICISEDLMRQPGGGAVGLLVPSGPGSTDIHKVMSTNLRQTLFQDNVRGFGAVSVLTRWRYLTNNGRPYLAMMYQLLGDPATRLNLTQNWTSLNLPGVIGPDIQSLPVVWPLTAMEKGRALVWIEDEDGQPMEDQVEVGFSRSSIRHELALPPGLQPGARYRVVCYAWDEAGQRDAVASSFVEIESPTLELVEASIEFDGQTATFDVIVENKGRVDVPALPMVIERSEGGRRFEVARRTLELKAGERKPVQIAVPTSHEGLTNLASRQAPTIFEAVLKPAVAPSDLSQPAAPSRVFALLPDSSWTGFVPRLSQLDIPIRGNAAITAVVMATDRPVTGTMLRLAQGDGRVSTSTLNFEPVKGGYRAQAALSIANSETQLSQSRIELVVSAAGASAQVLDAVDLESIPEVFPRLRIVPNSIRHEPREPTDGQTVYFTFALENIGRKKSNSIRPTLHVGNPLDNAAGLPIESADKTVSVSELGPGRRTEVTLRWDPVRNAGLQEIWIALNTPRAKTDAFYKEQIASYQFYVKSKSDLSKSRFLRIERTEDDVLNNRFRLVAEVVNDGETEARNVQVTFFSQPATEGIPDDEDEIGELILDVVPPLSRREVPFVWQVDRDLYASNATVQPSVIFRLKGSSQRIVETADGWGQE